MFNVFNAGGEIQLPRVVWFTIIGVTSGLVIMYGIPYLLASIVVFGAPMAFIVLGAPIAFIFLVDNAVDRRRAGMMRR